MRLPPIQEAIHWLEIGQGARALRVLVAALLLLGVTLWYDFYQTRNFSAPDAMEVAQLARNLSRGDGFTTQVVRPLTIQWVEDRKGVQARLGREPHPDLFSPPVYPLLLAGWMKLLPFNYEVESPRFWRYQPEILITVLNQLLFFGTVWVAYRLARRLIGGEAAVLLAIMLFASELLWRFSASGLSTMLAMLLGACLLWVLSHLEETVRVGRRPANWFLRWGALAGLMLGLIGLTRYAALVLIIPVTLYYLFFLDRRAVLTTLSTWLVCAAVVAPWLARNYQVSGTLFGVPGMAIYEETLRFPDARIERSFAPDLSIVENPDLLRKGAEGLRKILSDDLLKLGGGWFGAFFLVGLIGQYRNPGVSRLRVFLFLSLAALTVAQSLGYTHLSTYSPAVNTENLLVLLTPGVFLVGVAFYYWLIEKLQLPFQEFRHVISTVLVLGTAAPLLAGFLPPRVIPVVYPPYYPPYLQETSQYLKPSEALMTDLPWATAWYGDRLSVWAPVDGLKSFYTINDDHKIISGLLLSPLTTDAEFRREILQSKDHYWSQLAVEVLLRTNVPTGFPLKSAYNYGFPDHLFLADYARWRSDRTATGPLRAK